MSRVVSIVALALCLSGCGSGTLVFDKDGIDFEPRRDGVVAETHANDRNACRVDHQCNRPLTVVQEQQQRDRERKLAARKALSAGEPAPLPAIRLERDASCEPHCAPPETRSLMLPAEPLPPLPDPLER
ncbi:MAG: hypothetical protein AAF769_09845 [Pseudomonadota bacterium]